MTDINTSHASEIIIQPPVLMFDQLETLPEAHDSVGSSYKTFRARSPHTRKKRVRIAKGPPEIIPEIIQQSTEQEFKDLMNPLKVDDATPTNSDESSSNSSDAYNDKTATFFEGPKKRRNPSNAKRRQGSGSGSSSGSMSNTLSDTGHSFDLNMKPKKRKLRNRDLHSKFKWQQRDNSSGSSRGSSGSDSEVARILGDDPSADRPAREARVETSAAFLGLKIDNVERLSDRQLNKLDKKLRFRCSRQQALTMLRRGLLFAVVLIEKSHAYFNPTHAYLLDGWSGEVISDIATYDQYIERVYDYYFYGRELHPLAAIVIALGTSALWHVVSRRFLMAADTMFMQPNFGPSMRDAFGQATQTDQNTEQPNTDTHSTGLSPGPTAGPSPGRAGGPGSQPPQNSSPLAPFANVISSMMGNMRQQQTGANASGGGGGFDLAQIFDGVSSMLKNVPGQPSQDTSFSAASPHTAHTQPRSQARPQPVSFDVNHHIVEESHLPPIEEETEIKIEEITEEKSEEPPEIGYVAPPMDHPQANDMLAQLQRDEEAQHIVTHESGDQMRDSDDALRVEVLPSSSTRAGARRRKKTATVRIV